MQGLLVWLGGRTRRNRSVHSQNGHFFVRQCKNCYFQKSEFNLWFFLTEAFLRGVSIFVLFRDWLIDWLIDNRKRLLNFTCCFAVLSWRCFSLCQLSVPGNAGLQAGRESHLVGPTTQSGCLNWNPVFSHPVFWTVWFYRKFWFSFLVSLDISFLSWTSAEVKTAMSSCAVE